MVLLSNKKGLVLTAFMLTVILALSACTRDKTEQIYENMEQDKKKVRSEIKSVMEKVDSRLKDLRAKTDTLGTEAARDIQAQIDELEQNRKELLEELGRVDEATRDSWEDIKSNARKTALEVEREFSEKERTQ